MTDTARESTAAAAVELMTHYSFDQGETPIQQLVNQWLQVYPAQWVRLALIEALYQGRYKAISVEQILALWQRRGQPIYRFNHEFERLVCNRFPRKLSERSPQPNSAQPQRHPAHRSSRRTQPFFMPVQLPEAQPSPPVQEGTSTSPSSSKLEVSPASNMKRVAPALRHPEDLELDLEAQAAIPVARIPEPPLPQSVTARSPVPEGVPSDHEPTDRVKESIHQFVPISEPSGFCTKLTAIALSERARKVPTAKVKS